jgi:hypothetical protein
MRIIGAEGLPKGGRPGLDSDVDAYHALCGYTLAHRDPSFIHQHVVDAFAAQHAGDDSKPIGVTFALVGLYLSVELRFSGRQVQRAHMQLTRRRQRWPAFVLPRHRGSMTAADVMAVREGPERDQAIRAWCESVWAAFVDSRQIVADLLRQRGIV